MRMLAGVAAAAAVMGLASVAYAANATGDITHINIGKDSLTLDNGSTYIAPPNAKLSNFKVGEPVTVTYNTHSGKKDATSIAPAQPAANNADLGG